MTGLCDQDSLHQLAVSAEPVETDAARLVRGGAVDAGAGHATVFDEEHAVGHLAFRRRCLDPQRLDPETSAPSSTSGAKAWSRPCRTGPSFW